MPIDHDTPNEEPHVRENVQDEPLNMRPDGTPDPQDPQAGMLVDDDSREPETARLLHPRVGDTIGPS